MPDDGLGKAAEQKLRDWLNRPQDGYAFDRFYDQMSGLYLVSRNVCDFHLYKYPNCYYIESKSTWQSRFEFNLIQEHQLNGLVEKSKIKGCFGWIIVLFASHKRAFKFNAADILELSNSGKKSLNIDKIDSWTIDYKELKTVPNSRKTLLDYTGEIEDLL